MKSSAMIVLTGGPGGGKSRLIQELQQNHLLSDRIAALPEAIFIAGQVGISPRERLFQRVMVHLQMALEDSLQRAFSRNKPRAILCQWVERILNTTLEMLEVSKESWGADGLPAPEF